MLGSVLGSPEYQALSNDKHARGTDQIKQDDDNQTLIELNVNDINL
jgi:hypothetical protein